MQSCLCLILVENHSCTQFDWLTVLIRSSDEKERRYVCMYVCMYVQDSNMPQQRVEEVQTMRAAHLARQQWVNRLSKGRYLL